MTCREIKLLTDENVAWSVVLWLREQGLDVLDVKEMGWFGASDDAILERTYQVFQHGDARRTQRKNKGVHGENALQTLTFSFSVLSVSPWLRFFQAIHY